MSWEAEKSEKFAVKKKKHIHSIRTMDENNTRIRVFVPRQWENGFWMNKYWSRQFMAYRAHAKQCTFIQLMVNPLCFSVAYCIAKYALVHCCAWSPDLMRNCSLRWCVCVFCNYSHRKEPNKKKTETKSHVRICNNIDWCISHQCFFSSF